LVYRIPTVAMFQRVLVWMAIVASLFAIMPTASCLHITRLS